MTNSTYNIWDEAEKVQESFGSVTRTKLRTFDGAGRLQTSEVTGTAGTPLPKVTDAYNTNLGTLETETAVIGGKTTQITTEYNALAHLEHYLDSDGDVSTYKYGDPENDGLLEEVYDSSKGNEGTHQSYSYDETTKRMSKLVDYTPDGTGAGTFTASYDAEGKMISEVYPNGMCANFATNSVGEAIKIEYVKTTNCKEAKPLVWFSESRVPSVRGETLSRTSTLAAEAYTYDTVGRLTQTQETPSGQGCTTRLYAYDEETNRTALTTRKPGGKGECVAEGGAVEKHMYDEANRMTDSGIGYDSVGNVTKLPAADAEGHEIKTSYYVDNAVASQEQNGIKNEYTLDPSGRVHEVVTAGKAVREHYDGPGETVAWMSEGAGGETRYIPGIGGTLAAIQVNRAASILQLQDLEGNVVATAALSPAETKLLTTYNSTEFGVPSAEKTPPKYGWLGATGVESSLPSGVVTYGATSYVPQTARSLQTEEVEAPGLSGGSGVGTAYVFQEEPWNMQGAARESAEAPGLEAGRQREAEEAACRANVAACNYEYAGDPEWIWHLNETETEVLAGSLDGYKMGDELSGLRDLFKDGPIKYLEGWLFKTFTTQKLEDWAFHFAGELDGCLAGLDRHQRRSFKPTCRVAITTEVVAVRPFRYAPPLFTFELPDLNYDPVVSYCLVKETWCYLV